MGYVSVLHHQVFLVVGCAILLASIAVTLYVPWAHAVVRIKHSQYELNYPLDIGLLHCFSDVCKDYGNILRLIRDVNRQYRQTQKDMLPQYLPYPSYAPTSNYTGHSAHSSNNLERLSAPTIVPTIGIDTPIISKSDNTLSSLHQEDASNNSNNRIISSNNTSDSINQTNNTANTTLGEGSSIVLPPIHVPKSPPALPPIPAPVLPPVITTILDDPTRSNPTKFHPLIDRDTLRKVITPFALASKMTIVFLVLATVISISIILWIVYDAFLAPFFQQKNSSYSSSNTVLELVEHTASNFNSRYRRHGYDHSINYNSNSNSSHAGSSNNYHYQSNLNTSDSFALSDYSTMTSNNAATLTSSSNNSSNNQKKAKNIKNKKMHRKYSPTRAVTPPAAALLAEEAKEISSNTNNTHSHSDGNSNTRPKNSVKDLVQFYESPVKEKGRVLPPSNTVSILGSGDSRLFTPIKDSPMVSPDNNHGNKYSNKSSYKSTPVSPFPAIVTQKAQQAHMDEDEYGMKMVRDEDEQVSDSESECKVETPRHTHQQYHNSHNASSNSISENNSYTNSYTNDEDECNHHRDRQDYHLQHDLTWHRLSHYRFLNMMFVSALGFLFIALAAYVSFTLQAMTLRGSYYSQAVWCVTYALLGGLFVTLRIAMVMLDEAQQWYEERYEVHCQQYHHGHYHTENDVSNYRRKYNNSYHFNNNSDAQYQLLAQQDLEHG